MRKFLFTADTSARLQDAVQLVAAVSNRRCVVDPYATMAPMPSRPGPRLTSLLRMPVALYEAGYGWVLGHRFLALTHRGRHSGRLFTVVLEVVDWRPEAREAVVMSGFGRASQWYRNVLAGGAVEVRIGRLRFSPTIRELERTEAAAVLAAYERRNRLVVPVIRAVLSRLAGFSYDGSSQARERLVEVLPLVALSPASTGVDDHTA